MGERMPEETHEILVFVQNPPDYLSWSKPQKLEYYENVVRWHEYVSRLMAVGEVTKAWGAEKLPGRVRPIATKTLLIAIYHTTLTKFSELIARDPLWDSAWYQAPILKSIETDYETDLARYKRQRTRLEEKLGKKLPKAVLQYTDSIPKVRPGGTIEILVTSGNTPGYLDLSDEERLEEEEKVVQMHDYHRPLREGGVIVDEWGTYQNCGFGVWAGPNSAKGVYIVRVSSYDEFDDVFISDPVRNISRVQTVVLVPFQESWQRAERELLAARERFR